MNNTRAVITADILNSTQFLPDISNRWLTDLISLLKNSNEFQWALEPEIFRGDSFQGVLEHPEEALKVAIAARTFMRSRKTNPVRMASKIRMKNVFEERSSEPIYTSKITNAAFPLNKEIPEVDIRIAIGIGKVDRMTDRPGTSDGEAFRLSGSLADRIKQQKARIGIALPSQADSLSAVMDVLETLVGSWSAPQCEVILGILNNESASTLATKLDISKSAVSQRLKTSNWWAVERLILTFPELINRYLNI